ncbi:MAG: Omp28-related outer membrane protein [Burkholderiales bacterium]|nr:Omp28-related outer membrane protein [Bacteroidia bacterium]
MKKQLLTILAVGTIGSAFAQLPVSTTPQNKKIVLEEFTGIYCGYCPDGHTIANSIYNNNPGKVVLINIHSGGYATVAAGEPDLKTTIGTAIDAMPGMGITGYPAGTVNRTVLTGTVMSGGRGSWTGWANTIKAQAAYCNVAIQGNLDATTRVLTYTAQVYYTANSPATSNSITIVLLENKVYGPQHNYGIPTPYNASNYNVDDSYNHNHVLRKGLTTGNFGVIIPATTAGTTFTTTGTYTVPATYGAAGKTNLCLLGNLELAAFVTQSSSVTINGAYGPINTTNYPNALDGAITTLKADAETCAGNVNPGYFNLINYGGTSMNSASIEYSLTGGTTQTVNFAGALAPYTHTVLTIPAYSWPASATNTLNVAITTVNGAADPLTANNVLTKAVPLTTKVANTPASMDMIVTTDQYGSETTWAVMEEVSGITVASGGPYTDLAASGTSVQPTVSFVANPNLCYKTVVYDVFGDGFNAGTGAGKYQIKSGGVLVYTMSSAFTSQDTKLWKTTSVTGLNNASGAITNISLFPNPAKNNATLTIDLVQNETISINVVDVMGRQVFTESMNDFSAGNHTINLNTENWANGVYNVNISTENGTTSRKLVINK